MTTVFLVGLLMVAVVAGIVSLAVAAQRPRPRLLKVRREPTPAERLDALRRAREDR